MPPSLNSRKPASQRERERKKENVGRTSGRPFVHAYLGRFGAVLHDSRVSLQQQQQQQQQQHRFMVARSGLSHLLGSFFRSLHRFRLRCLKTPVEKSVGRSAEILRPTAKPNVFVFSPGSPGWKKKPQQLDPLNRLE